MAWDRTITGGRLFWPITVVLLTLMGTVQVVTALGETQTWDEGIHIAAGYACWKGDYRWNIEHPPLVKMMSALPLLPLRPKLPVVPEPWLRLDQVQVGIDFLYKNRVPADTLLFRARAMTILLTLIGGLFVALWTRGRFGVTAGLLALTFYALDPNLIAHGRYVTTDAPMAVFYFLTCAAWCDYLLRDNRRNLLLAALSFALALAVKFSAVLLGPVILLLYALRWLQVPKEFPVRRALVAGASTALTVLLVLSLVYWRDTVRCVLGESPKLAASVSRESLTGRFLWQVGNAKELPRFTYLAGLDAVAAHNSGGHSSYLLGMHSDTGWWYYFPVVFTVKSTLAAIVAVLLVSGAALRTLVQAGAGGPFRLLAGRARAIPFRWIAIILPALFYFTVSATSAINLGVRHILPVYPLLYVAAAGVLASLQWKPLWRYAAFALIALQAAECASIYPDYLAFFNVAAGGPGNGPKYLVDSNIDWGQDVKKLRRWLGEHGTRRVWINYFGKAELGYYGIEEASLPVASEVRAWEEIDGYAAASVTPLYGVYVPWGDLEPLRRLPVVAKVGYSIYVYDLRKHPNE